MCVKKDILSTLAYFNMFDYPLRKREIFIFLQHSADFSVFEEALIELLKEDVVFKFEDLYCLHDNCDIIERRYLGNRKAYTMLRKAHKVAAIISSFPFVEGVAVSGSLSKQFAGAGADIDFFIITAAHRLWIARTFLHLFKKITYLVNMQHFFCMNYFVDESELCIREKNIYTATEVVTVLPLRGIAVFEKFFAVNTWTKMFLPNHYIHVPAAKEVKSSWLKFMVEKIFDNSVGNAIDNFLMRLTAKRWNAKVRRNKKNKKGIPLSLHHGKHFAKPDPENFQKILLQRYEKSVLEIIHQYETASGVMK